MGVPIELVGAWRRSGLIWKGKRVIDYVDAIWLQTPEWFVDIRIIMDPDAVPEDADVPAFFYRNRCFAGHTTWEAPQITWNHEIDSNPAPRTRPDTNRLVWGDSVVLECGSSEVDGVTYPFIEEWLRTTDDDVTWSAEGDEKTARIEVGRWAVEVTDTRPEGRFTAIRYEKTNAGWTEYGSVTA
jgi:hypothetical protein